MSGNTHQAMWMGTREQLYHFDKRCDNGFFNIEPTAWVEFWSVLALSRAYTDATGSTRGLTD